MRTETGANRTGIVAAASLLLTLAGGLRPDVAAAQAAADAATSVDVGFDMGEPGATVSLAIQLSAPDGIAVGSTVSEITFPAKLLTFEEARGAPDLEADVTSVVRPDPDRADHAVVEVTVTARSGGALSNGLLASAVFRIAEGAQAPAPLKLKNVARATTAADPPVPIEPVAGRDGEVELIGAAPGDVPAVIACFFYMH